MMIVGSSLSQTCNNAFYVQTDKIVDGMSLVLKILMAIGTNYTIAGSACLVLNTVKYGSIVMGYQIGHYDPYNFRSLFSQTLGKWVRPIVQSFCQIFYTLLHILANLRRVAQGTANGSYADTQFLGQILQRGTM